MELNVRPLGDKIILKQDTGEYTSFGLRIDGERPFTGEVLAVGNLCEVCKVGDKVQWQGMFSNTVFIKGIEYKVIREIDLLFIDDNERSSNNKNNP